MIGTLLALTKLVLFYVRKISILMCNAFNIYLQSCRNVSMPEGTCRAACGALCTATCAIILIYFEKEGPSAGSRFFARLHIRFDIGSVLKLFFIALIAQAKNGYSRCCYEIRNVLLLGVYSRLSIVCTVRNSPLNN